MPQSNVLCESIPRRLLDSRLDESIVDAIARIRGDLARLAPHTAGEMNRWIDRQTSQDAAEDCFRGMKAHFLLIPWFLETSICADADLSFQRDLIYSSINAYYFVRLLDNITDGHHPEDVVLLPLAALFHASFQSTYSAWFPPGSSFWDHFHRLWIGMADATVRNSALRDFSESDFIAVSAKKIAAVQIPVAAVCFRYRRSDLLGPWLDFYQRFACSHEMLDDLCDWHADFTAGRATFLLSEAYRQKRSHESIHSYLIREGLAAGYVRIQAWLGEARSLARGLDSPMLESFVQYRYEQVERFWCDLASSLGPLKHLAEVLEAPSDGAG